MASVATTEKPFMASEIVLQPIKDIFGTVKLPGSKFLSNLILLLAALSENDYMRPIWLPLLQMVVGRISHDEEKTSVYLQLLGTLMEIGSENDAPYIPDIIPLLGGENGGCLNHGIGTNIDVEVIGGF
ncbi:unnamed protein product [Fraxinus pennsylvanica]|uniref:Uncharacterized protein n=1 Tax=Fraxinus pennsylvanica TaxID=56036 RepID=A0AAD2EA99_9LAMI|nr:unnamed protein product [Fraxinus pennsylvanica]